MESARWTLDELVSLARRALLAPGAAAAASAADQVAAAGGMPNGRVRQLPDRRIIRWYTTIGLVDRPLSRQGRVAWYGERHLRQVVAVKRLQAMGQSLVDIQARLAGASDEQLSSLAQLAELPALPAGSGEQAQAAGLRQRPAPVASQTRFWTSPAVAPGAVRTDTDSVSANDGCQRPPLLTGVPLPGGALLLLPAVPNDEDLAAIMTASRELAAVLRARNLVDPDSDPHNPLAPH